MEKSQKEITIIIEEDKEYLVRYALGRIRGIVGIKDEESEQ